jgi:hypothetical protein
MGKYFPDIPDQDVAAPATWLSTPVAGLRNGQLFAYKLVFFLENKWAISGHPQKKSLLSMLPSAALMSCDGVPGLFSRIL